MRPRLLIGLLAVLAAPLSAQQQGWDAARDEAVHILQGMVRIDSSSPPGNETLVAEYIRDILASEGIESRIYEMEPGRGNLVARIDGNGSRPRPDNPIVHLAAAIAKFESWQPPMRLNSTTREYFRRMAEIVDDETAYLYRNLENPAVTDLVQEQLRLTDLSANSMLRTSISPTIIEGGFRRNVIPAEATATLDIRALPEEDTLWLKAEIERVIGDPAVEVVRFGKRRPVSEPMPIGSDLFRAIEHVQAEIFPGAVTIPTMLTGGTDSSQLRAAGVLVYGIGLPTDEATGSRAHGNDERTPVEGLGLFVRFLYRTVLEVAGS